MYPKSQKGFSLILIELLLVVVAIILIIAAIAVPNIIRVQDFENNFGLEINGSWLNNEEHAII